MTAGMLLSLGTLKALEWTVRNTIAPEKRFSAGLFGGLTLLKFTLIGFFLWAIVRWNLVNLIAFGAGFAGVHLVIFLKVLGGILIEQRIPK